MSDFMTIEGKSHIQLDETFSQNAKVKVVGVGGAGGNALNRMKEMNIQNVEFIAVNTDALALDNSLADEKIAIGKETTKNLGAGARPEVGRKAILEDRDTVAKKLEGADMVFIAAGMGGGTGTGAAPVVAEIARSLGILTVAVVCMPFKFEGPIRRRNAKNGMAALKEQVDSIIVIDNNKIMDIIEKSTRTEEAYLKVDEVLGDAVRGVVDIIMRPGTINIDFQDIRRIMENGGKALMGTGCAEGEDRALRAAEGAITCPLLGDVNIQGASGILVNISHGENFTMMELDAAMNYITEAIGISMDDDDLDEGNEEIIFGDCMVPELGEKVTVTVFATKFFGDIREAAVAQSYTQQFVAPQPMQPVIQPVAQPVQQPTVQQPVVMPQTAMQQQVQQPAPQQPAVAHGQNPFVRRESYTPPKTTNFAAMLVTPKVEERVETPAPVQTTMQFAGFAGTQDLRAVTAHEEELVAPKHVEVAPQQSQPTFQQPTFNTQSFSQFQQPTLSDQPSFAEQPTITQPALNMNADTVAGGIDLSASPSASYKSDTRSMESLRGGFMNGSDF